MQLVQNTNLLPPSICIICETVPDGEEVVDTLRIHKTGVASPFNGRKYVCERCVATFAKLFGYEKGTDVKQAFIDKTFAERKVERIKMSVKEFGEFLVKIADQPFVVDDVKPEVEDVFPEPPVVDDVTTEGVQEVADSETPAVPAPAAAKTAKPKAKPKAKKEV